MAIEINKFILCDDIRIEKNDKLFIIGMYGDDRIIVHSEFPYIHPMLSFFVKITGEIKEGKIHYRIIDPEGEVALEVPPQIINKQYKGANLTAGIVQFIFKCPGEYKLSILLGTEQIYLPFFVEQHPKKQK
ncbi:hypothetical protein LLG96_12775 [bacterium]|nr:hypothetical protein [bacterium]